MGPAKENRGGMTIGTSSFTHAGNAGGKTVSRDTGTERLLPSGRQAPLAEWLALPRRRGQARFARTVAFLDRAWSLTRYLHEGRRDTLGASLFAGADIAPH